MISNAPNQIIILLPEAGNGWLRKIKPMRPSPNKLRNPRRPLQPIPSFDRRALCERVARHLRQTQAQREGLKAAHLTNMEQALW
jgi:hypothetical protein